MDRAHADRLVSRAAGQSDWVWHDQGGDYNRLRKALHGVFPAVAAYPLPGAAQAVLQASEELPEGLALVGLQEGARPRTDEVEVEGAPAGDDMAALPGGEFRGQGAAQRRVLESRRGALRHWPAALSGLNSRARRSPASRLVTLRYPQVTLERQ